MALAITNQKTIKDESKDKLYNLYFLVKWMRLSEVWLSACVCVCVYFSGIDAAHCVSMCACVCVRGGASEWVFVCNHVRQAIMNGVFETAECGVPRAGPNWKQKNKHSLESPALHLPYP